MYGDYSPLKFSIDSGFTTRYRYGRRRCVPVFRDMRFHRNLGVWLSDIVLSRPAAIVCGNGCR